MSILSLLAQSSSFDNSYNMTTDTTVQNNGAALAFLFAYFAFLAVLFIVLYAVNSYFLSRIFKKAGVEGWKAWVPVYNSWIMYELGEQKGYWAVLAFVPIVNIAAAIYLYIAMYHIGLKFGKDGAFVLLAIFVPIVWIIWLAVDKSTWSGVSQPVGPTATPAYQPPSTPDVAPSDDDTTNPTPPTL